MKATDLLLNQHREVDQLFEQLDAAEAADKKTIREELAQALVAHSTIEKELLYPALKEALREQIEEAYVEHGLVEYALSQLLSTRPNDETFRAKAQVLKALVQKHVQEEETGVLPQAEGALGAEQLEQLGEQMEARFEQVRAKGYKSFLRQALAESAPGTTTRGGAKQATTKAKAGAKRTTARRGQSRGASQARGAGQSRGTSQGRGAGQSRSGSLGRSGGQTRQTAKQGGATGRKGSTRGSRQGRASSR